MHAVFGVAHGGGLPVRWVLLRQGVAAAVGLVFVDPVLPQALHDLVLDALLELVLLVWPVSRRFVGQLIAKVQGLNGNLFCLLRRTLRQLRLRREVLGLLVRPTLRLHVRRNAISAASLLDDGGVLGVWPGRAEDFSALRRDRSLLEPLCFAFHEVACCWILSLRVVGEALWLRALESGLLTLLLWRLALFGTDILIEN